MKNWTIKIEQYCNKWVTLIESKTATCHEEDAIADVQELKRVILDSRRSEITDRGNGTVVIIDPSTGPVRISYREAYFKK